MLSSVADDWCEGHASVCKLPRLQCAACLFLRERAERGRQWLFRGAGGFGCSACARAGVNSEWAGAKISTALGLRKQSLDRHEQSKAHVAACSHQDIVRGCVVPPLSLFEQVWLSLQGGVFSCAAIAERCGISRLKALNIKKCFRRACLDGTKKFLASDGLSLALHQDASQSWLCVRYTGCSNKLQKRAGLLGFVDLKRWADGWAENLKDATLQAVAQACSTTGNAADADVQLMARVLNAVEIYNADGAADEQLAGRMLKGQKLDDLIYSPALMPNLKVVHKDKTHAARRLATRGWAADAYLSKARQYRTKKKRHQQQSAAKQQ